LTRQEGKLVKSLVELWDDLGVYLKQLERFYSGFVCLVIAGFLAHIILASGPGEAVKESAQGITRLGSSAVSIITWSLLTILCTVLLIRIFRRLRLKFKHTENVANFVKREDLSVHPNEMISELLEYRTSLAELCSRPGDRVVEFVNKLISVGFSLSASDIYLSPRQDLVSVTMRVHGQLYDLVELKTLAYPQVTNRIKVLSDLAIYKHNVPQDGQIRFEDGSYTARGERIAIRLVTRFASMLDLDQVGMPPQMLKTYKALLNRNQGMIILTGPTGSGKSTTMFASLLLIHKLRGDSVNIVTLEDPIETDFTFFHQTQIDPLSHMTFATGLRSILRQDPDIIMLGEIRDEETAVNAMRAAMTGHLLFTTVHASSTTGVFDRLTQMGIGSVQLSSAIHAVLSQRLCRRLCENCRKQIQLTDSHLRQLRLMGIEKAPEGLFFSSEGCDRCLGKGYTGRLPLFEMLMITDSLRDMIAEGKPAHKIYSEARKEGMQTLFDHGLSLASQGKVSLAEVIRLASS